MKAAIAFIAALAISRAQINLNITPIPDSTTARVLDKSISKILTLYLVTAENQGPDVMLMESSVIKKLQGIAQPVDHTIVQMIMAEGDKNSWPNRGGRIIADLAKVASFLTAGGIVALGHTGLETALSVQALGPYFMQQLRGIAPPIQANYNQIAWTGSIILHEGETAVRYVFGSKQQPTTSASDACQAYRIAKKMSRAAGAAALASCTAAVENANYHFTIQTTNLKKIPIVQ